MPHREFLEAARSEKSDITLQALCDRLLSERDVKADTSMMSRFFRRIVVTLKKRPNGERFRAYVEQFLTPTLSQATYWTLLKAWASMKSFRPKDGSGEPPSPGRNGEAELRSI